MANYNGWANYETWNVALWLGNDEGCYHECIRLARHANHGDPITEDQAETLVTELMPGGTPDFKTEHHGKSQGAKLYKVVYWDEIANCINEMAGLEDEPETKI